MSNVMPALTLWQPWACLIEVGAKPYETRHFQIPRRLLGKRVAIHAAKRPCFTDFSPDALDELYDIFGCGWNHFLQRGVIVCSAVLAETLPVEKVPHDHWGNYEPGRFAWRLEDVRPISPHIAATGKQQIGWDWKIPEGLTL